ncbi:mitotic checkpoint regulator, MAD2B-interacting-domain-containing protein [Gloeopeniophorella convolvens]|nr:mitotic checkpoint regulator, MAD2B-interacting-domain-containing protein [Gloeopeniophorella convolvens]
MAAPSLLPLTKKPSLLPPSNPSGSKSSLALPASKAKKAPKKIAIDLPALSKGGDLEDDTSNGPPAKKQRVEGRGVGSSGLFSMLPAPKLAAPVKPPPERVLGSGKGPGLVFNTSASSSKASEKTSPPLAQDDTQDNIELAGGVLSSSLPFMPSSVKKGKANISLEDPSNRVSGRAQGPPPPAAADLFSLGASVHILFHHTIPDRPSDIESARRSTPLPSPSGSAIRPLGVSAAPKVDECIPPEPTPDDPYPGYYRLPSGTWAAYDAEYYNKFYDKWKTDYDRAVRALEKGTEKGFEGAEADDTQEVNALREMEKAKKEIQEREEKKALTTGASGEPAAPKMNIKGSKISKGARKRGQLASLLVEAYQNREVLEERIAEGRRNRKEAGNKYESQFTVMPIHFPGVTGTGCSFGHSAAWTPHDSPLRYWSTGMPSVPVFGRPSS